MIFQAINSNKLIHVRALCISISGTGVGLELHEITYHL